MIGTALHTLRSGTYTFESTNDAGCTHVATLTLTINNSSTSQESATACEVIIGTVLHTLKVAHIPLSLQMMLDVYMLLSLTLTINNSPISQESVTACDSYNWNGTTYTESGTCIPLSLQMMLDVHMLLH